MGMNRLSFDNSSETESDFSDEGSVNPMPMGLPFDSSLLNKFKHLLPGMNQTCQNMSKHVKTGGNVIT